MKRATLTILTAATALMLVGCEDVRELRSENERLSNELNRTRARLNEREQAEETLRSRIQEIDRQQEVRRAEPTPVPTPAPAPAFRPAEAMPVAPPAPVMQELPDVPSFSPSDTVALTPFPATPSAAAPSTIPPLEPRTAEPQADSGSLADARQKLEVVLGDAIRQGQVVVENRQDELAVVIWSNLVFDGQTQVASRIQNHLKGIGDIAAMHPDMSVQVQAHSSSPQGSGVTFQQAQAVADYLRSSSSLSNAPTATGAGANNPRFSPGSPEAQRGANDRVEIILSQR